MENTTETITAIILYGVVVFAFIVSQVVEYRNNKKDVNSRVKIDRIKIKYWSEKVKG